VGEEIAWRVLDGLLIMTLSLGDSALLAEKQAQCGVGVGGLRHMTEELAVGSFGLIQVACVLQLDGGNQFWGEGLHLRLNGKRRFFEPGKEGLWVANLSPGNLGDKGQSCVGVA
jgi:hypothetical protein